MNPRKNQGIAPLATSLDEAIEVGSQAIKDHPSFRVCEAFKDQDRLAFPERAHGDIKKPPLLPGTSTTTTLSQIKGDTGCSPLKLTSQASESGLWFQNQKQIAGRRELTADY